MSSHTKETWVLSHNTHWKTNPFSVVVQGKYGVHSTTIANIPTRMTITPQEQKANALLIAAAPDLLEALVRLRQWAEADKVNYTGDHPVAQARAAIAKATGSEA